MLSRDPSPFSRVPGPLRLVFKGLGAALLAGSMLGWVAERSGPPRVEVVVHVAEPDVEVGVGGRTFRVEGRAGSPLVCELPPGRHELLMTRGGRALYREMFEAPRGKGVVLTAWDATREPEGRAAGIAGRGRWRQDLSGETRRRRRARTRTSATDAIAPDSSSLAA